MGCGNQSKQLSKNKDDPKRDTRLNGIHLDGIKHIIDSNLEEIGHRKHVLKTGVTCSRDISSSSRVINECKETLKIEEQKEHERTLSQGALFYTEILQREVFRLSADLKSPLNQCEFQRNVQQAKRIQSEIKVLVKNLPIYSTNSIFVRCNQRDTNHFQCLIMGSKDTPYAYGAFLYDLYCDNSFPTSPPKLRLLTTGGNTVRFNPNLYVDGYICLSLLGTWSGKSDEQWNETTSNILQILLSIQSLVMNENLYYNEPSVGSVNSENEARNRAYQNIVKIGNIKHAMIDQLNNPDPAFKDLITMHFFLNKQEIMKQCDQWINEAKQCNSLNTKYEGLVKSHNPQPANRFKQQASHYTNDLIQITDRLKKQLDAIDISSLSLYNNFLHNLKQEDKQLYSHLATQKSKSNLSEDNILQQQKEGQEAL